MHIAVYFHKRLPVRGYGGTQRVIVWLVRGLVEAGHRVTLLAAPGSRIAEASVVPIAHARGTAPNLDAYLPPGVDLLHSHVLLSPPPRCPHISTVHGNLRPGQVATPTTIFLSADHARRHDSHVFVHNGVDPADYRFRAGKSSYDLFLGRLHRIKGYQWAIEGARRAGRRLVVAGGWRPSLRRGVRFVGEVGGDRKAEWLAGARCLWMPALWDEPFGLTLLEALVSGTPVLGTRRGALPEVVGTEVGRLGDTLDELVSLRPEVDQIDPYACRTWVERRFTHRTMAEGYLRMYRHYLSTGILPPGQRVE